MLRQRQRITSIVSKASAVIAAIGALTFAPGASAECELWRPLDTGVGGRVTAMVSYNGDLIVAGNFIVAGADGTEVNRIARWDGAAWHALGEGLSGEMDDFDTTVQDMTVYNDELIVAGSFHQAGGQLVNRIARWDGQAWHPMGVGFDDPVFTVEVYDGQLYVGGFHGVERWNGSFWEPLGNPASVVSDLQVFQGELVHVIFELQSAVHFWDGRSWEYLGPIKTSPYVGTLWRLLELFDGQLIAAGADVEGGVNVVPPGADNPPSEPLGGGLSHDAPTEGPKVWDTVVYDNELILAGEFSMAGDQAVNNIVRWDGESWSSIAGGMNNPVRALCVHNGNLYAGGDFTAAGGSGMLFVGRLATTDTIIQQHPQQDFVAKGETAVLSVSVGSGELEFEWRKDGELLTDDGNIDGATTDTLTISNVSASDVGAYDVRITTPCGSVLSNPAAVSITNEPSTCPADIAPESGDGAVNVTDLLELLSAWGACP